MTVAVFETVTWLEMSKELDTFKRNISGFRKKNKQHFRHIMVTL